jgi:uncharacterized membrane protein (DUF373 family)
MQLPDSKYLSTLEAIIRFIVKLLAFLMIIVIFVGVADVVYVMYERIMQPPIFFLTSNDMLAVFGAFMLVLIAIEIFINIVVYLREEIIHVRIVLATAIVAVARKVIVFDYSELEFEYVIGTGLVIVALCLGYWLTGLRSLSAQDDVNETGVKD